MPKKNSRPSFRLRLDPEDCARLVAGLGTEALGAAFRLMELHLRAGVPVADDPRARVHAGIDPRRWSLVSEELRAVFDTSGGKWVYPPIAQDIESQRQDFQRRSVQVRGYRKPAAPPVRAAATAKPPAVAKPSGSAPSPAPDAPTEIPAAAAPAPVATSDLAASPAVAAPAEQPAAPAQPPAPAAPTPRKRKHVGQQSLGLPGVDPKPRGPMPDDIPEVRIVTYDDEKPLRDQIIERGVKLLVARGRTHLKARICMTKLLVDWDVPFVIEAVDEVFRKRDEIQEPYSRMISILRKNPKKAQRRLDEARKAASPEAPVSGLAPQKVRPLATAENVGLSAGMIARIRQQNSVKPQYVFEDVPLDGHD